MALHHSLERVVIIPRNGYINRIQALASAKILADQLEVPLSVFWEPEPIAPAACDALFDVDARLFHFIDKAELTALIPDSHEHLPRYLNVLKDEGVIVLAGHDRGEQVFMNELKEQLRDQNLVHTLLIIAGGNFHLTGTDHESRLARERLYKEIPWSREIKRRSSVALASHPHFVALHLRSTDRSREAPTRRQLKKALRVVSTTTGIRECFIAADTSMARNFWQNYATSIDLDPWSIQDANFDRAQSSSAIDAMVDWIILGRSQRLIYSASSSFGEEAAVATGNYGNCIPLTAHAVVMRWRDVQRYFIALINYSARKFRN